MNTKRVCGWSVSCLLAGVVLLLLCCPTKALALNGGDASPAVANPQGVDIAGGSTAATTEQSTVEDNQSAATTTPSGGSNPSANQQHDKDKQKNSVTNNVNSDAQSGNATVTQSPAGGNATSGSSTASATLINTVASSAGPNSTPFQTSTDNVTGNQTGDIAVNPATGSQSPGQAANTTPTTVQTSSSINNNVTLLAGSGDATVQNNGVGGNATTGPATADANLINLIDSTVNDQQSFLDIINIFGNLTGNIVLPQSLIDALTSAEGGGNGATQVTNNFLINNQVTLLAQSGQAEVMDNGNSGNATSGNAATNLQLYNLINSQINGGNLLLVLVNVLGTWNGLLLNEPAGTDTATLGSSVQDNTPSQTTPTSSTTNETINNNLYLDATSGNALDAFNGQGGNATSGNAMSSADIVNILGDQINLSGWLGILMINVFGSWNGSIVTATPAVIGVLQGLPSNLISLPVVSAAELMMTLNRHFGSLFTGSTDQTSSNSNTNVLTSAITDGGATIFDAHPQIISVKSDKPQHNDSSFNYSIIEALLMALAVSLLITERVISHRQINQV